MEGTAAQLFSAAPRTELRVNPRRMGVELSTGHRETPSGGSQVPFASQTAFPTMGVPPLRGRGSHPTFVGLVGRHSSFPERPPGTLWGVGQRTAMGMDAASVCPL